MYSEQQIQQFLEATRSWLQELNSLNLEKIEQTKIDSLKAIIRFHEYEYYVLSEQKISDFDFDSLFKVLEKIETLQPNLKTSDSPTQRIANSLNDGFATVQHLVPMLSLSNSYNAEDLIDFDRKAKEASGLSEIEYCVEPKFDGASISLIYENNELTRAATRGDGVAGDDITTNIKQIRSIPLQANFSNYGIEQIEIRGEVIMTKSSFEKYNEWLTEQGLANVANPRNTASGSLRIKDPKEVAQRNLDAFLYHVSYVQKSDSQNKSNS